MTLSPLSELLVAQLLLVPPAPVPLSTYKCKGPRYLHIGIDMNRALRQWKSASILSVLARAFCLAPFALALRSIWSVGAHCLFQPWLFGFVSSSGAVHCWGAGGAALTQRGSSLAPEGEPSWLLQKYCAFVYGKNHQDWINLLFLFDFHGATLLVHVPCEQSYLLGPHHTVVSHGTVCPVRGGFLTCDLLCFYVVI